MKPRNFKLCLVISLSTLSISAFIPVSAANPQHVKQLLETKICPNCDLSGASLFNAHLHQANLQGADLTNAKLGKPNLSQAFFWGAVPQIAFWRQAILPLISGVGIFSSGVILGWTAKRKSDR